MAEGSYRDAGDICWNHSSYKDHHNRSGHDDAGYFELASRCDSAAMSFDDNEVRRQLFACSLASSSMTELSSLYSMGEDEFDRLSSQTVQNLLNDVDAMLYDPAFNSRCPNLVEECASWTSAFPHMRIQGQQIGNRGDDGFQFYPTTPIQQLSGRRRSSGASSADELPYDINRLTLSGKHVAAVEVTSSDDDGYHPEEEIIAQDGVVEETIAVDRLSLAGNEDLLPAKRLQRGLPPVTPVNCWRDCVVSVIFDDLRAHLGPFIVPLIHRLLKAKHSGAPHVKIGGVRSWKQDALRMMQPPSGIKDLYHDDFDLSPLTALSTPESTPQTVMLDKISHTPTYVGTTPYGAMLTEASTLDGLLTVRSKALSIRDKSSLTSDLLDDTSVHSGPTVAINRPKTSISALYSSSTTRSASAQRQASTVLRPGRLVPLLEEDPRRILQQQYASGSRPTANSSHLSAGLSHSVLSVSPSSFGAYSSGQVSSQSSGSSRQSLSSAGPIILGPSPSPSSLGHVAGVGSTHIASIATTTTAGAVMRSLLPPISHKRDVASANINRALPVHRAAIHSGSSSQNKEQRLLPARDRDKSLTVDAHHWPSATHTLYRSETSMSNNRRSTAGSVNSRTPATAFDAKRNHHPMLNVTGSSMLHQTDHTMNPRSPEYELMDHGSLSSGLHAPQRRFRTQNIVVT